MQLADILSSLFPAGHEITQADGLVTGWGRLDQQNRIDLIGIAGKTYPGVDEAIALAGHILSVARRPDSSPLLFLVDSGIGLAGNAGKKVLMVYMLKLNRAPEMINQRMVGIRRTRQ